MNKRGLGIIMWIAFGLVVLYLLFRSRSALALGAGGQVPAAKLKDSKDDWANLAGTVVAGGFSLVNTLITQKAARLETDSSSPDFSYGDYSGAGGAVTVAPAVAQTPDFSFGDFSGGGSTAVGYSPDFSSGIYSGGGGRFTGTGATGSW